MHNKYINKDAVDINSEKQMHKYIISCPKRIFRKLEFITENEL